MDAELWKGWIMSIVTVFQLLAYLLYSALPRWNWSSAAFLLPVGVLPASVSSGH